MRGRSAPRVLSEKSMAVAWRSSLLEVVAAVMYRDDPSVILIINIMFNIKLPPRTCECWY